MCSAYMKPCRIAWGWWAGWPLCCGVHLGRVSWLQRDPGLAALRVWSVHTMRRVSYRGLFSFCLAAVHIVRRVCCACANVCLFIRCAHVVRLLGCLVISPPVRYPVTNDAVRVPLCTFCGLAGALSRRRAFYRKSLWPPLCKLTKPQCCFVRCTISPSVSDNHRISAESASENRFVPAGPD